MPYCPDCHREYDDDLSECLKCETDLVARLPKALNSFSEWVIVSKVANPVLGEMVVEALRRESIPALFIRDFFSSAYGIFGTSLPMSADCAILVPKSLYPDAEEIVDSMIDNSSDA